MLTKQDLDVIGTQNTQGLSAIGRGPDGERVCISLEHPLDRLEAVDLLRQGCELVLMEVTSWGR